MFTKKIIGFLLISVGTILFSIVATNLNLFSSIENKSWDYRLSLIADGRTDPNIKIIIVDQASLDSFAKNEGITWPWPRTMYLPLIRYLKAAGAKGVAFDLIFSEGSIHGVEEDIEFASELGGDMPIVSAVAPAISEAYIEREVEFELFKKLQVKEGFRTSLSSKYFLDENGLEFKSATFPVKEVLEKSQVLGSTWVSPDSDGIFRHYWSGGKIKGVPILSLAFSLFNAVEGEREEGPIREDDFDSQGRLTLKFKGDQGTYKTYPIADVISSYVNEFEREAAERVPSSANLSEFKDAWVFIGVWAPGLLDLRPTPLDEVYKGVEYHATVLDNLIHSEFIHEVEPRFDYIYSALFVLMITCSVFFIKNQKLQFFLLIFTFFSFVVCAYLLAKNLYWIKLVIPFISVLIALLSSLIYQYYLEGRERRFLKNAFSRYVSPELIQKIIRDPKSLMLGGERRELTIFFSDLAGFTGISESMAPDRLVSLLNNYLTEMTNILLKSGATLDKYEGDAIIAFWNAPIDIEDHPYRALSATMECQRRLLELTPYYRSEYGVDLKMRIGLHTGMVNVGNFGSHERFDYTVIGDAANLAARLEGVNKVFGTSVLISESTQKFLGDRILCRRLGSIRVVGRLEAVSVFEPLEDSFDRSSLENFTRSLSLYEENQKESALRGFLSLEADPVAQVYVERIKEELAGKVRIDWTPVWNLSSK